MAEETENIETTDETSTEAEAPDGGDQVAEGDLVADAREPEAAEEPAAEAEALDGGDQVAEGDLVADSPEPEAAAEPEAEAEAPADEPAAPAPQSEPKRKRKRLPRAERPKKGRRVRTPSAERKSIVRLPKPERERGRRQERRGVVVSSAMDKTIVVKVDVIKSHPRYKKVVRRSVKFHAHDEQNAANVGDVVRIVETRPLSATKRWRLAEIVEVAK
jgi:small subunit ribosomal protein S17